MTTETKESKETKNNLGEDQNERIIDESHNVLNMSDDKKEKEIEKGKEKTELKEEIEKPIKEKEKVEEEIKEEASLDDLPLPESDKEVDKSTWPKGFADRLNREKEKRQQLEEETNQLRIEMEKAKIENKPQLPNRFEDLKEPHKEDFESDEAFVDARFEYIQEVKGRQIAIERQAQAMSHAENEFQTKITNVRKEGSEQYSDFDEVTKPLFSEDFPPNRAMAEAIVDSDYKRDILYFLGKYPQEAKKIALLNPVQAIKKIAEIEHRFHAKKKSHVVKSEPIIEPTRGSDQGSAVEGNPDKMSVADFRTWYERKYGRR